MATTHLEVAKSQVISQNEEYVWWPRPHSLLVVQLIMYFVRHSADAG